MTDRKGLVPVTLTDEAAAETAHAEFAKGRALALVLPEAFARHRADALTEALRVVREARDFADAAAGEGFVLNGIDAADLHDRLTAFIAQHEGMTEAQRTEDNG